MNFADNCKEAILNGDIGLTEKLANKAISENIDINLAIDAFSLAIREAGDLFEEGEFFLPELMRSAEAMKAAMTIFEPILKEGKDDRILGKVVIGTIEGDIHDIGKTLVAALLSAEGFEVHDLGADVPISAFIDKAVEVDAQIICISALLTTTMVGQKKLINQLKEKKLRDKFKILIGGAPISKKWVKEIGADGSAENAVSSVKLAREVLGI
ncbi:MAG: corrinoid protein [Candidatus Heimdallarchaeota archaeon]|nr:dimethylamine corrinoid protein 3 [Candidatus Heimdallarchaeota archaeon]MCG3255698.1 corrinoid protein [Candidatus Heimdallarchaeota archaeon]MCK4610772.1 corrinoid protein [Candidatus Heimdallarchaeota archaeon]